MISFKYLRKQAVREQTSLTNIVREYVQHLFLAGFYQSPDSRGVFFKGGTALKLIHNSPRFSEDLDFSSPAASCKGFEAAFEAALSFLERSGIGVDILEVKKTSGGCLAIFSAAVGSITVRLQLEVSLRVKKDPSGEAVLIKSDFIPPYTLLSLSEAAMVEEKIRALIRRGKPRDFYDLYFILRSRLTLKLSPEQRKKIIEKLSWLESRKISRDLREFLPRSHHLILKNLPLTLERELKRG